MKSDCVRVRNVFKSYESENFILDGLNLTVKVGEIFALIGASGCGKTTLLQCILGMKNVDKGSIKFLGNSVGNVLHRIGYMPQQTQLIPELTIKETVEYFGNIFEMKKRNIETRFRMIFDLLQLPSFDRKIENLSGGERRRVSLAMVLIHSPKLLILDEPTVGLDPVLCDEIWKFFKVSTSKSDLTILLTTHSISEAIKSDCVGFMRNGQILVEDAPEKIMKHFDSSTFDKALVKICESEENECQSCVRRALDESEKEILIDKRKRFGVQRFLALLKVEFIRVKRQPWQLFFILFFPLFHSLLLENSIGGSPSGIKVGILNQKLSTTHLQNVSREFLNEISEKLTKISYKSYNEAYQHAKQGKILGFLEILPESNQMMQFKVHLHLDQSNFQHYLFLTREIFKAYERFERKASERQGIYVGSPIKFEKAFYSSSNLKSIFVPPFLVQMIFGTSLGFTCFSLAQNRRDGFWNLTLMAGIEVTEILFVQLLSTYSMVLFLTTETLFLVHFLVDLPAMGNVISILQILSATCVAGSAFGAFLASFTDNTKILSIIIMSLLQLSSTLSGSFWPVERQFWLVRYFSNLLPTTLPSVSLKDIMIRGFGLSNSSVMNGFSILSFWALVGICAAIFMFRRNKFH